ncbi:DNA polymerase III subunit beta [Sulfitobacter pacificus]|uniref:DNA polymerase III subunit beta n=1 Tax=Sulfitobacter pacificus TaxID=1499314 RepID=UPI0031091025
MKFTCETKALTEAMAIAGRVIPQKSPWPILINIKMVTNDDRVTMIGSDGDTTFEVDVPASVEIEGAACLAFATFDKFVKAAKATQVSVEMDAEKALVKSGRGRITLMSGSVDDYPIYKPTEGEMVTVDAPSFAHSLRFCAAAASTNEARYHLCGVNFDESQGHVIAWGTNGKVAHKASLSSLATVGGGGTIPSVAAQTILALVEKSDTAKVLITDRGWGVESAPVRIWGKVIDGKFPNMAQMMDQFKGWDDLASVEHSDMTDGLSVASCGADTDSDKSKSMILNFKAGDGIVLRGGRPLGGVVYAGRSEVTAEVTHDWAGGFNSKYITNAMSGLKVDRVAIKRDVKGENPVISICPAQADSEVEMMSVIHGMRMSEAELADV